MSAWAPLRRPVFFWLWVGMVLANVGTAMRDVAAGWLMTELAPEAYRHQLVALVQAMSTLPLFLLAIPAGALADVVDRRILLMVSQGGMCLCAALLAVLALTGGLSAGLLLTLMLLLGIGAALSNPAGQTAMTDMVGARELPAASALNSIALNLSRAIGPTLGGLLVGALGAWSALTASALSFVGILWVLAAWRYRPPERAVAAERFAGAIKAALRYVRHHRPIRNVLVRTAAFVLPASALWAQMPLLAKDKLGMSAMGYGVLMGCLGGGAVVTALVLPRVRARLAPGQMVLAASVLYAVAMLGLAACPNRVAAYVLMALAGAAWITNVTSLNVSAQLGVPAWVRARALACYLAVFFGGMSIGSVLWGVVAAKLGVGQTLAAASAVMFVGLLVSGAFPLQRATEEVVTHDRHWDDPIVTYPIDMDDGPVVITVEYRVSTDNADAFIKAMKPVRATRYRDGAITWILSRSTDDPERWLEVFIVESWAEHLRQHDRVTLADRKVQEFAKSYHVGPAKPTVGHYIAQGV